MRKMGAKTLVEEELEPNQEIAQEFEDVGRRIGESVLIPKARRLSFFGASCPDQDWHKLPEGSFLGYAVVVSFKIPESARQNLPKPVEDVAYILESVTQPPGWCQPWERSGYGLRRVTNYYVHCHNEFRTSIGSPDGPPKDYTIDGAFFCQQNGITHVCAHAGLRMVLNTGYGLVNHKVTNREINDILGINHVAMTAEKGLNYFQNQDIGKHFGLSNLPANFIERPNIDYVEFLYPLVESGYPAFLTFNLTRTIGHVVAVVGHTVNSDRWDPEAGLAYRETPLGSYLPSSTWVDQFILNDDNFGMYRCMPPEYLRNKSASTIRHDATSELHVRVRSERCWGSAVRS